MPTDAKGNHVAFLNVLSFVDGDLQLQVTLHPKALNAPVIDAIYAVLDDIVDRPGPDGDDGGGEPVPVEAAPAARRVLDDGYEIITEDPDDEPAAEVAR
jgi:hypothetical protein